MTPKKQDGAYETNKRPQALYYTSPVKQVFVNRHHTKVPVGALITAGTTCIFSS